MDYMLSVCHFPEIHSIPAPRCSIVAERKDESSLPEQMHPLCMESHRDCITLVDTRKPLCQHLPLGFLQTCRQIYHEAVLTPFSVNEFHYNCLGYDFEGSSELLYLLEALVPIQVRAIKRLALVSYLSQFPSRATMQKLTGLKHLRIQIDLWEGRRSDWQRLCGMFARWPGNTPGVAALRKLHLKSLHITTLIQSDLYLSMNPDVAAFVALEEEFETRMINPTALKGRVLRSSGVPGRNQAA